MNGWIKHFSDGTSELGSDTLVAAKQASWQNGRHDGLVAVDIHWRGKLYTLSAGKGEYWQSDTMVAMFSPGKTVPGKMMTRRISKKLCQEDVGKYICHKPRGATTRVWLDDEATGRIPSLLVDDDMVGKWLLLELGADTGKLRIILSPTRK